MNNNNNENFSLSPITPSTQLPRARSAIFPVNDLSTMNKLCSTRLAGTLSTDDDDPAALFPVSASNPGTTGVNSSDMIFTDHQRKQSNPRLKTTSCYFREPQNRHQTHCRRSSIILNEVRPSTLARHKSISMELSTDFMGSKLTLDEELYDIIYAFLWVFFK